MQKTIQIETGELAVGHNDTKIKTGSVGSCVVIVLYDEEARVGGMAHAMLPSRPSNLTVEATGQEKFSATYVEEAVDGLLNQVKSIGGKRARLKAKLVGGATMFKVLSGDKYGIGFQNIEAARRRLSELFIPIVAEDTGGSMGKIVEFNLVNGLVDVSTKL
ncbi:MAG TPA: chemotaxis protein CheD [Patescibacteria group bacterium]